MGYNRNDYIKVRNEFENKYLNARRRADERVWQVHELIPEIRDIDAVLSKTGMDIMAVITSGVKDTGSEIAKLEKRNNDLIERRNGYLRAHGFPDDYTDVHYDCPKCGDTGYVDTVMCECMKKALTEEGYRSSGLGMLIGTQTFDNFELDYYSDENGMRERVRSYISELKTFSEGFCEDTYANFLMIGKTGLGKTHLSTAVAQRVIERGFDVLYVSSTTMFGDFEAVRFNNSSSVKTVNDTDRYYGADLLIIDDLGTEMITKFTSACLNDIINFRINNRKSTIINTNFTAAELNEMYTERISSRLMGEYLPMLFRGVDIRKQKNFK